MVRDISVPSDPICFHTSAVSGISKHSVYTPKSSNSLGSSVCSGCLTPTFVGKGLTNAAAADLSCAKKRKQIRGYKLRKGEVLDGTVRTRVCSEYTALGRPSSVVTTPRN